jgi:hypothetical protein
MNFTRIHADGQGETHFGVQEIPDLEVPFGPPPNPKGAKAKTFDEIYGVARKQGIAPTF